MTNTCLIAAVTPPIGDARYGLRLDLTWRLGGPVDVTSPSHAISVNKHDGGVRVTFEQPEVALDRDVVVIAVGSFCSLQTL